jgi:endoglucanase
MNSKVKFVVTTLLLAVAFLNVNAQPVKRYGHLQVKGTRLCDEKGSPVVLRGMSFGWHNFWPRFYNEDAVAWLANDWDCSVVRAAMGIEPRHGYKEDSAFAVQKIKAVVDGAIKNGIYVIIDWHSHNINLRKQNPFLRQWLNSMAGIPM